LGPILTFSSGPWLELRLSYLTLIFSGRLREYDAEISSLSSLPQSVLQLGLTLGDVDQDIEDMAGLCDELLDSDISTDSLTRPIMHFASTVDSRDKESPGGKIPSDKVISCLRRVIIRLPDLLQVSIVLAKCLFSRFVTTVSDDDYNEGMAILDKVIKFRGPGDTPSPYQIEALLTAVKFSSFHFFTSSKPDYLEHAINLNLTLLDRLPPDHPFRDEVIETHSFLLESRFDGTDDSSTSESGGLPSFRDLTASLPELSVKPIPKTTLDKHRNAVRVSLIADLTNLTDIADIEDGVNYCQQLIASYPGHQFSPDAHMALSRLLLRAFECTNEIEYLDRSISAGRDGVNSANSPLARFETLIPLIQSLHTRLSLFKRIEDVDETIQMLQIAAENPGQEFDRPLLLREWASVARHFGHSSVSTAYERAMSSMQACLTLSPTLDIQHSQLVVAIGNSIKSLPFDYASHQIHTN